MAMPNLLQHVCSQCGSQDVQLLMPCWLEADSLKLVEVDYEAEALSTFCVTCGDAHPLITNDQDVIKGRWHVGGDT